MRRKLTLFEATKRFPSSVLVSAEPPIKRESNEQYLARLNAKLAPRDAIAKAERAVVKAAVRLAAVLPGDKEDIGFELGAVFNAVDRLRAAQKAVRR